MVKFAGSGLSVRPAGAPCLSRLADPPHDPPPRHLMLFEPAPTSPAPLKIANLSTRPVYRLIVSLPHHRHSQLHVVARSAGDPQSQEAAPTNMSAGAAASGPGKHDSGVDEDLYSRQLAVFGAET